jgi:hypothetical protein
MAEPLEGVMIIDICRANSATAASRAGPRLQGIFMFIPLCGLPFRHGFNATFPVP